MKIKVLTSLQQSQYSTPVFVIHNKEVTVRFIVDFHRINQQLVRKSYPLPILGKTMQKLEGFQYVTSLDINMGYYMISLYPASQYMTNSITTFVKFRYNRLPMGMCTLGDIFQEKVDNLLVYI